MPLTRVEQERLSDSRLRIQSVVSALSGVDPAKVPNIEEIQECLKDAEENITLALRARN
jgi:hypothetical protein